jgi:selenophosphate synthetase-related protein
LNEAGTITSTADVARSGSLAFAETILAASRVRIGITISRFPAAKAVMIASRISGTISRQVSGVSAATRPG